MSSAFHTDMQNALVRMVVPMRREFGRALDVQQMRQDPRYAEAIVAQALTSPTQSLRDNARVVGYCLAQDAASAKSAPARSGNPPLDAALAARLLIDLIGPSGEALAIRIERAPDAQALAPLLDQAHARIAGMRGESAAAAYLRRTARRAAPAEAAASRAATAALRRDARRAACELVALIGTFGDELAERMERSRHADELLALIAEARDRITGVAGVEAADDFAQRVKPGRR